MTKINIKSVLFVLCISPLTSSAHANPLHFARAMRMAGTFAASSFVAHEAANANQLAAKGNMHQHTAYAMTTTGFAAIGGMYLGSGIPAAHPMGCLFLGMSAWGHYQSYKQHRS